MINLDNLVRENIKRLKPYSSARSEFSGAADVFLDANENALGSPFTQNMNRYPDPLQSSLKNKIAAIRNIDPQRIFLGNGSDEAIDLLIRCYCEPGRDRIMIMPPTYGMYGVCADINNVEKIAVPLRPDFNLDTDAVINLLGPSVKLIFICSPNNPSANMMAGEDVARILQAAQGLVVLDEAYIDFAEQPGWLQSLRDYPNLVILQTVSKAWGLAGIRLGMAFAHPDIITVLNRVKPPYNVNELTQQAALQALAQSPRKDGMVAELLRQRVYLQAELPKLPFVKKVFSSQANFLLVRFESARPVYDYLLRNGIIVRDRSTQTHCEECLRITVGSADENRQLIGLLQKYGGQQ